METEREEIEPQDFPAERAAPAASAPADGEARGPAREGGPPGDDRRPRGRGGRRRRVCIMCADKIKTVDYKNVSFLRRFISDRARIDTRRKTSACAKHQRAIATGIKRARHLALLPYTAEHIRTSGVARR